jgi:hypothetical protein
METTELIQKLYDSFGLRDGDAMAQCYAPSATFADPGFGELHGEEIGGMWRMLCATNSQLTVSVSHIVTDDASGSANWEARYLFDPKKKSIVNKISATYRFEDGLIVAEPSSAVSRSDFHRHPVSSEPFSRCQCANGVRN